MNGILFILLFALCFGCSTGRKPLVEAPKTWGEKKRECHSYYLNMFGFTMSDAVKICKEELEKN